MSRIKLGLVGIGAIARAQHLPVLAGSKTFELAAAASRDATVEGVRNFATLAEMLREMPEIEAVSLCTPPAARYADACLALEAGKHVLLEKPPGATVSEVQALADRSAANGKTLNASWHSRHAPGVPAARRWLTGRTIRSVEIVWREDVRHWHPGQDWIFEAGGLGVFDPGINALSIVTHILPAPFWLQRARLSFPENRQAPVLAELAFADVNGKPIRAVFDFLQTGPQTWDIRVKAEAGRLELSNGGSTVKIDGKEIVLGNNSEVLHAEYTGVYGEFASLIAAGKSGVDLRPMVHVADAFLRGERVVTAPFHF